MRDTTLFTLANGIRVIYQNIPNTKIVHCGVFLDIGSRDESYHNQGIAHFWEHMAFKGTRKRTSLQIINSLESVGGELNAYTDKEKIVFYASLRDSYFDLATDVLTDIAFHSSFPAKELEKERGVILEEMAMYLDDPDDSLQDEFETVIYGEHPMGMNILGRKDTVKKFRKKDFVSFCNQHLDTNKIVFSVVGNIPLMEVEAIAKKYLEPLKKQKRLALRKRITPYKAKQVELKRPVKQAKCAIGRQSYSIYNKDNRYPFFMLVNILGGPGMNSRLNLALREKYGFVYSVDAHFAPYSDTGMFAVFFGTEPRQLNKCVQLVQQEMNKFCDKKLSSKQLLAAKEQLKGQLAMAEENNLSLMLMAGRVVLDLKQVPTIEEIFKRIDDVSANDILRVAQDMFKENELSYLQMIPENGYNKP
ncbi:MAG: insulinase family protein [Flammeovirgaceae bacterium]|nr:insulinase family protein [Flammeovirgaceae bacterium]